MAIEKSGEGEVERSGDGGLARERSCEGKVRSSGEGERDRSGQRGSVAEEVWIGRGLERSGKVWRRRGLERERSGEHRGKTES